MLIGNNLKVEFKVDSYGGRKNRGNEDQLTIPGWGFKLKIYPVYDIWNDDKSNEFVNSLESLETKAMVLLKYDISKLAKEERDIKVNS